MEHRVMVIDEATGEQTWLNLQAERLRVMVIHEGTGERAWLDLEQEAEGFYHAAVEEILSTCGVEERNQRAAYLTRVVAERIKGTVQSVIFRRADAKPPASR